MAPVTTTRDLLRFRALPKSQTAIQTLAQSLFSLLSSAQPQAAVVRSAFLPALLASDRRPSAQEAQHFDEQLKSAFASPPDVVVVQGLISLEQIAQAAAKAPIAETLVFVPFALHQEVEAAKAGGEREAEANLNMLILAVLTRELAHWIFCKVHGYHPQTSSDAASISSSSFGPDASVVSLQSFTAPYSCLDVGVKAVHSVFGFTFELLTFAVAESQVVKRRASVRRTPSLTPPLIYSLIGDTPAIVDITAHPPTHSRWVVPWHEGDSMWTVVSSLSPFSLPDFHGTCRIRGGEAASEYSVDLRGSDRDGK